MREALSSLTYLRAPAGLYVWSSPGFPLSSRTLEILRSLARPVDPNIEPLKSSSRRSVLRIRQFAPDRPSVIVKGFPLRKIESRWKYRKYGLTEFYNYKLATAKGIPAPNCYAYFELRSFGFVKANGVIVDDLVGWRSLAERLQAEPLGRAEILSAAIPLLRQLFDRGVNHIDPSPHNILQSPEENGCCLIDWQYCSFVAPRRTAQLVLQAAHFLRYAEEDAASPAAIHWLGRLFDACQPAVDLDAFRHAVKTLQARGKTSSPDRLALRLDPGTREILAGHAGSISSQADSPPARPAITGLALFVRHLGLRWRWRRILRKRRTLRLAIGDVAGFLQALEAADIRCVVLRWFDEVPLIPEAERATHRDVDLLVDGSRLRDLVRIAARFPGTVKCDFYSPAGRRGTTFKKMPYFPPVLGEEILSSAERHPGGFLVPGPLEYFRSFAFHLAYHKGAASGIPTGAEPTAVTNPARPYGPVLEELGTRLNVPLARPYTLLGLHHYLKSVGWAMPYDLIVRWPEQTEWLRWLHRYEESLLEPFARRLPNLIVFFLRADADQPGMAARSAELLQGKFRLLRTETLDDSQIRRVMRLVRGGNWLEHGHSELVEPRVAMICHDPDPKSFAEGDPRRRKYPLVRNANVLFKEEVRKQLNELFPRSARRVVIHGSDNEFEAQEYLMAIFDQRHPAVCAELERAIATGQSSGLRPDGAGATSDSGPTTRSQVGLALNVA